MKKLSFYFLLLMFLSSCSTTKSIPENEHLLTENIIIVDSTKQGGSDLNKYLIQRPNAKALGLPLSLYFYNLGNTKASKDVEEWQKRHPRLYKTVENIFSKKQSTAFARTFIGLNQWYLKNGQAPVIIDNTKTRKTVKNLETYYQTQGFFRAKVASKRDTLNEKKGTITYYISKGKPSFLDSISTNIKSPVLDSIYSKYKANSFLKIGDQYKDKNFVNEANRITKLFRNKGIYHFSENNILFRPDTLNNYQKTDVEIDISDKLIEKNGSYISKPFKIQKIKRVNVFTDYLYSLRNKNYKDSINYDGINFYAHDKLKYNPKYLSQSIFIKPNQVYTDSLRSLTRTHLRGLKNFKASSIRYNELNDDELEANVVLTPIEKYTLGVNTELSRSNIREFDISAEFSLTNRNIFKGAEIFQISLLGSYFNSRNGPGWEIGATTSLEVPRFMAPFGLNKFIPKSMFPKTRFYTGTTIQKNIGLDRQNITAGIDYRWQYNKRKNIQIELLNTQYIRNLNVSNYFNVYSSEYNKLVQVAKIYDPNFSLPKNSSDIVQFMRDRISDTSFRENNPEAYQDNSNIYNRYRIITSDFLIPVIAYNFSYNNQENIADNDFSYFRFRIANSGNFMGLLSKKTNSNGQKTVFEIPVAQYFKTDFEYKKFWTINSNSILAHRTFLGAIITYSDSSIPFSKSYFAGGSNDIRAWRTYDLGPGVRQPGLEYNIGSLKFLSTFEYRFNVVGSLKSALFIDAGNIWDITNSSLVDDESKFNNLESITNMAVGLGFGVRYDFKFLVARLDIGFKAREPYLVNERWFKNFNFGDAVYNIGINYPF